MSDEQAVHRPHRELADAEPGDWLEVDRVGGGPRRRAQILEVLESTGGQRFRVRWNEESETLHTPAEGDLLIKRSALDER